MPVQPAPRRSTVLREVMAAVLVFTAGVALRLAPRHWTPLPFNPDGFNFAAQAERTLADGQFPLELAGPHGYSFPTLLTELGLVTDASALSLTQPAIAVVGATPALFAFAFVRRIGHTRDWATGRTLAGATAAGFVLATEGLYLRRTAAVSYEVLGILLVVSSALVAHRWLATGRPRWLALLAPVLAVLPVTHHLSTMMAALALTAVATVHLHRTPDRTTLARTLPVVGLFWLYFGTYYVLTRPPYYGDLAAKPGLFLAWVVLLPALVVLFRGLTPWALRLAFALPFGIGFLILAINAVVDVFPGTAGTHPRVLVYVAPLGVFVVLSVWATPIVFRHRAVGPIVVALFLGPLVFVGFALTAGLSPVYELFARRSQTFVHLSVMVMAAVTAVTLGWRARPALQPAPKLGSVAVVLACALVSVPLAFAGPPVLPYESTTTTDQFESITFAHAHLEPGWTSDDHLTRVGRNYYGAGVSPQSTFEWLRGSTPPDCPVIVSDAWTSGGAQGFPGDPIPVDTDRLDQFVTDHATVYAGGDSARHAIVRPVNAAGCSGPERTQRQRTVSDRPKP